MKCPHCGKEIADDSQFCEVCGMQIKPTEIETKSKRLIMALIFLIVLSIVLGIAALIWYSEASSWESRYHYSQAEKQITIEQIYHALKRPLIITNVEMGNVYENGEIETDYGCKIYSSHTLYLKPKVEYVGVAQENITLYVRLYCPDGSLSRGGSSPKGYSTSTSINTYIGKDEATLSGWGSSTKGNWERGKYKLEIWYDNTRLYKKEFTIY